MFRIAIGIVACVAPAVVAAIILPSSPLHRRVNTGMDNIRLEFGWYRDLLEFEAERIASRRREMQKLVSPAGAEKRYSALRKTISMALDAEDKAVLQVALKNTNQFIQFLERHGEPYVLTIDTHRAAAELHHALGNGEEAVRHNRRATFLAEKAMHHPTLKPGIQGRLDALETQMNNLCEH